MCIPIESRRDNATKVKRDNAIGVKNEILEHVVVAQPESGYISLLGSAGADAALPSSKTRLKRST